MFGSSILEHIGVEQVCGMSRRRGQARLIGGGEWKRWSTEGVSSSSAGVSVGRDTHVSGPEGRFQCGGCWDSAWHFNIVSFVVDDDNKSHGPAVLKAF